MALRILIADDHELVRDGLKPFLEELDEETQIIEAASLDEAIRAVGTTPVPDIVLLDMKMPGMDGVNGVARMVAAAPGSKTVILSGQYGRGDIMAALEKGASGYIPKTMSGMAMVNALRLVLSGETYLPAALLPGVGKPETQGIGDGFKGTPLASLTDREKEILGLLIDGNTNKEIARAIDVQEITVKVHLRNVYKKLSASNRADAVRIALRSGWES